MAWLALLLAVSSAATPSPGQSETDDGPRRLRATRVDEPPIIDGALTEQAWQHAHCTSGFWQRQPNPGAALQEQTRIQTLYDNEAIYVGVLALDSKPGEVRGLLTRRDEHSASDWLYVGFDSYFDRRTAFVFGLNAAGVQRDFVISDDTTEDQSWDGIWEGAAAINDTGWVAEYRIPLRQLRFSSHREQVWGFQVVRFAHRTREESSWSPWPSEDAATVSRFGILEGLNDIEQSYRLEVMPYGIGGLSWSGKDLAPKGDIGIDMKYGLSSNFTLSAAVNPDFGQVEADPSQVNLGAFETFLPERRPFFLEGASIFRFSLNAGESEDSAEQLFYPRRIGAPPHGPYEGTPVETDVDNTMIYEALKVSGKSASGWSMGLINAVTGEETGRVELDDGAIVDQQLEPLTSYSMLHVQKDLRGGRSTAGIVITAVHRQLETALEPYLHGQAYAGGVSYRHRFWENSWLMLAKVLGSSVLGSREAILETQQASQRYYQRPDATHLRLDPTRRSLNGVAGVWRFGKIGGNFRAVVGGITRSPGFEANDLGFQHQADYLNQWVWMQLREDHPGVVLRNWKVSFSGSGSSNYKPELQRLAAEGFFDGTFINYWTTQVGGGYQHDTLLPQALRGGPTLKGVGHTWLHLTVGSDSREALWGNVFVTGTAHEPGDSRSVTVNANLNWQARSNLSVGLGPSFYNQLADMQFVETVEAADGQPRHVVGRIMQGTFGLTVRASYTVLPTLSIQLYAQPFVSTGQFRNYKEIQDSRARRYGDRFDVLRASEVTVSDDMLAVDRNGDGIAEYSFESGDFRIRELRSNLVLRWEYLPGSTLFFIWSHGRSSETEDGSTKLGPNLTALGRERGEHVLMLKLSYWLGT